MLPAKMPIYCATSPVDLRRSFDGLGAAAKEVLGKDPRSGALFLFVNKAGDRLKALWWDRTGYLSMRSAASPGERHRAVDCGRER
jgi:transposase